MSTSALMKKARSYERARPTRALALARTRTIVPEKKGMDTSLSSAGSAITDTTNTNADCFVLNLVRSGAGSWERIGRKIQIQSVRLRGEAVYNYGDAVTTGNIRGNKLRMVVVWDKQVSGGAIPTFDSVFGKTNQAGTESCTFDDPVKYDNMDRFSVLKDIVIDMHPNLFNGAAGTTDLNTEIYSFDEYLSLSSRVTVFGGQTAPMTIADISTGALYVYFRSFLSGGSASGIEISANSFARLRYTDV